MGWSLHLGTVRGIAVRLHLTFLLVIIAAAVSWAGQGPAGMAYGASLVVLLFACVTLHEFGHAFAARRYGLPIRDILLLPIGGVAVLGRPTRDARQELAIAAAGPAVTVAIVLLLAAVLGALGDPSPLTVRLPELRADGVSVAGGVRWLLGANVGLLIFNLIPAFPLDGGRILRGLLGLWIDWSKATRWSTSIGQGLAALMGTAGFVRGDVMLVVIAALVFFAAGAARADERREGALASLPAGEACNRFAVCLGETDRLSTVVQYLLTSYQPDFAVLRGPHLSGVVSRRDVLQALARSSGDLPVFTVMKACPRVSAGTALADVRRTLIDRDASVAAVFDEGGYVGLVSLDDIAEAESVLALAGTGAFGPWARRSSAWRTMAEA